MGKSVRLPLLLILSISSVAGAAKDPLGYLFALQEKRTATFRLEEAKSGHAIALQNEKTASELHRMHEKLYKKHAIAEEEYRRSVFKRDLAVVRITETANLVELASADLAMREYDLGAAEGKIPTLEQYYAGAIRQWKAQCALADSDVLVSQTQVHLERYLHQIALKLHQSSAGSYEALLIREREAHEAEEKLRKSLTVQKICPEGLPTLESVRKIFVQ